MQKPVGIHWTDKKRVSFPIALLNLLMQTLSFGNPLCKLKAEGRRLIRSRAVSIDGVLQRDELASVSIESEQAVIKVGKRAALFRPDHWLVIETGEWITEEAAKNEGYYPLG